MKITDIRSMCLWGPLEHAVGGTKEMIAKIIVRVDTDAGIYGLGEVDDFMGVENGLAYMKHYLVGRDPMEARPIVSELLYGSLPPHHPQAKSGVMAGRIRAVALCSPTATAFGPVVWAVSGVEMALCDLIGKATNTPVYNVLGGKFRDRVRIYLDRSSPADVSDIDSWKKMATHVRESGFTQMKFDVEYVAGDLTPDVWNRSITTKQLRKVVERLNV